MSLTVLTLVENSSGEDKRLLIGHGLSFYIKVNDRAYLFDTGPGGKLIYNAGVLGIDLDSIYKIIISHPHFDHTGELIPLLHKIGPRDIYISNDFWDKRHLEDRYIGTPFTKAELEEAKASPIEINEELLHLGNDVYIVSGFKEYSDYEQIGEDFNKRKEEVIEKDSFGTELVVAVKTEKGLVVIVGCSHAGIVNILEHVKRVMKEENIYMVLGGIHLMNSDNVRIQKTIDDIKQMNIEKIGVCHCTGEGAINLFREAFKEKFFCISTGTKICI